MTWNCAGILILIIPPKAQDKIESLVNKGPVELIKEGFKGAQVPTGVGMQVPGVNTPNAAAVCAAVIGFAKLVHNPNGVIFTNGMQFTQVPIGKAEQTTVDGIIVNIPGAKPNEQFVIAPLHTQNPILYILTRYYWTIFIIS